MFEGINRFFRRIVKPEQLESASKDKAKERLHLVLMQDRANVSTDFLELMKQEIIDVIKKYVIVDEKDIDVRLTNQSNHDGTTGAPALYANIPIINIRNEMKAEIKEENGYGKQSHKIDIEAKAVNENQVEISEENHRSKETAETLSKEDKINKTEIAEALPKEDRINETETAENFSKTEINETEKKSLETLNLEENSENQDEKKELIEEIQKQTQEEAQAEEQLQNNDKQEEKIEDEESLQEKNTNQQEEKKVEVSHPKKKTKHTRKKAGKK